MKDEALPFGYTHRLADVGNRVHTRNDSDEDVRGNAYKQTIAWKALPWSFIMSHTDNTEHTDEPFGLYSLRFLLEALVHIR